MRRLKIKNYIVAAIGEWNKDLFTERSKKFPGNWFFADTPEKLKGLLSSDSIPDYIFFIHWRWIVPKTITDKYECVCFHMTDVPFGRGGSPLQNLIVRGYCDTVLTALKMDDGIDSGPVYIKAPLSLGGTAAEIYHRAANLSWDMTLQIIRKKHKPKMQSGPVTEFRRRVATDSEIPKSLSIDQVYDYIRMLDAEGYPRAFLNVDDYRLLFENAKLSNGKLTATVTIKLRNESL